MFQMKKLRPSPLELQLKAIVIMFIYWQKAPPGVLEKIVLLPSNKLVMLVSVMLFLLLFLLQFFVVDRIAATVMAKVVVIVVVAVEIVVNKPKVTVLDFPLPCTVTAAMTEENFSRSLKSPLTQNLREKIILFLQE